MNIAICDDDIHFLNTTCSLLEQWADLHKVSLSLFRFTSGDSLLLALKNQCMDLIILDVVMPLIDGIETAKELRKNDITVPIIFLTTSREFAVESYEVKALNYLLKPVSKEKIFGILNDFAKTLEQRKDLIVAQTDMGYCKIAPTDVIYLEAQNKQVSVQLSNGSNLLIRELFSKCEELFSLEKGFFKCHRSYIVNLNQVQEFTKTQITTTTNTIIPISRNSYGPFKETYLQYMFHN